MADGLRSSTNLFFPRSGEDRSVSPKALIRGVDFTRRGRINGRIGPFGLTFESQEAALLNDVTFEDNYLFRSDSRILTWNVPVPHH